MRIATWNVNSIRTRVKVVAGWLEDADADVLAVQETKCRDDQFPRGPFEELGYTVTAHGSNQWNGVALIARAPAENVTRRLPGQPEWHGRVEARALGATFDGVRVWSLYVPNGRALDDPHYRYKLDWLRALGDAADGWLAGPAPEGQPTADGPLVALVGDWNVAPLDVDVWSMEYWRGRTHVSEPERAAFRRLLDAGWRDVVRPHAPGYTFWDYQQLRFIRNEGMRIDHVLATPALAGLVSGAHIDRAAREGAHPSDHVPVVVDLALPDELDEPDDADRPMVF